MSYPAEKFPWHLQAIGLPQLWERLGTRGAGVRIGLIDSGVNLQHPELQHAHIHTGNPIGAPADIQDTNGHGTACAALLVAQGQQIYGVCPEAELIVAKIYDNPATISLSQIAQAVRWLVQEKQVGLISMSLGVLVPKALQGQMQPDIDALEVVLAEIGQLGVVLVSTVGNYSNDIPINTYPAAGNQAISVGAYDRQNQIYANTAVYSRLNVLAPGVDIYTADLHGYRTINGTSYAVPIAAGVIALVMARYGYNAVQARNFLKNRLRDRLTSSRNHQSYIQINANF